MRGDHEICGSVAVDSWTLPPVFGRLCTVDHIFTVGEARGLLPEAQARAAEMIAIRADLVDSPRRYATASARPLVVSRK
jgi:hypothetical protein